jgi:hypothetical protein
VADRDYRRNRPLAAGDLRAVLSGGARWWLTWHRRLNIPGCYEIYGSKEAAMITHTTVQALGQARLGDLHDQTQRNALVRAARRARRAQRQRSRAVRPGAPIWWRMTSAGRPRRVIRDG